MFDTHTYHLVREFHTTFGHPVENRATPQSEKIRKLRVSLIAEELGELCQALGITLHLYVAPTRAPDNKKEGIINGMFMLKNIGEECYPAERVDLVEAADALGDLDYVVQGANLVFGFPSPAVMREIHGSNMSKLDANGKPIYSPEGKILKGPNYREPDIAKVLTINDVENA